MNQWSLLSSSLGISVVFSIHALLISVMVLLLEPFVIFEKWSAVQKGRLCATMTPSSCDSSFYLKAIKKLFGFLFFVSILRLKLSTFSLSNGAEHKILSYCSFFMFHIHIFIIFYTFITLSHILKILSSPETLYFEKYDLKTVTSNQFVPN